MSKDLQIAIGMAKHKRKIARSFMEWLIRGKYLKIITIWMYFLTYDLCVMGNLCKSVNVTFK